MLLLQPTYTLLTADIVCLFALASEYKPLFEIGVVSARMSPTVAVVNTRTNSPSFGCYRLCTKSPSNASLSLPVNRSECIASRTQAWRWLYRIPRGRKKYCFVLSPWSVLSWIPRGLYYRQPCDNAIVFLPPYTKLEGTLPLRRVFPGTKSSYCMEHIRFNFPETCLLSLVASCRCTSFSSWTR